MKLFLLAGRNLTRNVRRTAITLMAITFGLAMVHVAIALQTGSYDDMITQGIGTLAGHVVVQAEGYQDDKDPDLLVADAVTIEHELAALFPEATIAPRIFLGGLLTSPTSSVGAALSGIEPDAEAAVQNIDDKVVDGEWLDHDDRGLLMGVEMAESLGVGVGDKVVWMGQYGDSTEMTSRLFRVKGIFKTGAASLDGFVALAPIAAARDLLGNDQAAHQVTVHLGNPNLSRAATDEALLALAAHDGIEVLSWVEALPEIYGLIQLDRKSGDVMLLILGIIVTMGVLNTVLMSALERTREFGVMMALGMKPRKLAQVILSEGVILGIVGAGLGLVAGLVLCWPLIEYGLDYSEYMGGETMESGGVAVSTLIKGKLHPARMGAYTLGAVVLTAMAALYPALHVSRLKPVDAMRHV